MSGGGSAAYRRVEVETASPAKLVVMLYNGAIKNAEEAKLAIESGDLQIAHARLIRVQEIVTELRSALNFGAGEVADNLDRVYEYMYRLLVQANVEKAAAPIEECVGHLRSLRDAWEEVFLRVAREAQPTPESSHNRHGHSVLNFEG
jgi:flagellar protein FliS